MSQIKVLLILIGSRKRQTLLRNIYGIRNNTAILADLRMLQNTDSRTHAKHTNMALNSSLVNENWPIYYANR